MNIRRYSMALRKFGFSQSYDSRAGGMRVVQFERTQGRRTLQVQLWDDGKHRATHSLDGIMDTAPTNFEGLTEMERAIRIEMTRMDHPRRKSVKQHPYVSHASTKEK